MENSQLLKQRARMHKPGFVTLFIAFTVLLIMNIAFSSCSDDDHEDRLISYGTVSKQANNCTLIKLDDGNILHPTRSNAFVSRMHDSTRLIVDFTILETLDSAYNVQINGADTILTKPILPYKESILDSMGNAPIKITDTWIVNGFLNFEFMYLGGTPYPYEKHMVNLLHHPIENNTLKLEFRHNSFNDARLEYWKGVVSFHIDKLVAGMQKPIKMEVKFKDSPNSSRTIDITYR